MHKNGFQTFQIRGCFHFIFIGKLIQFDGVVSFFQFVFSIQQTQNDKNFN